MMFRLAALISIVLMTAACKPIKQRINELTNQGKLAGVATCIDMSSGSLLSDKAVRGACVAKFQTELPPWVSQNLDGRGGPSSILGDKVFSGTITNPLDEYVVTKLRIAVVAYGEIGAEPDHTTAIVEGWFEPGSRNVAFDSLPLEDAPEKWGELGEIPGCDGEEKQKCWHWSIVGAWGLAL